MSEQIYGIHAVNSILTHSPERLIEVFVLKGREDKRLQPLLNELYSLGIGVQFVNRQTLDKKPMVRFIKVSLLEYKRQKNLMKMILMKFLRINKIRFY